MSWSVSVSKVPAAEFEAALKALSLGDGYGSGFARDEAQAQLDAAKEAAQAIFRSGAIGPVDEGKYTASLTGHAEPGHEPRPGYSGDMVYVQVARYIDYAKG